MIDQEITQEITAYSGPTWQPSIQQLITAWLHNAFGRSQSVETLRSYSTIINKFRAVLVAAGTDLDGEASLISMLMQGWASRGRDKENVSASMFNLRCAAVSSFYEYAILHDALPSNPMRKVARRNMADQNYALPIAHDEVSRRMALIDRDTLDGKRDFALISLALTCGRRRSELAALQWGDFTFSSDKVTVLWRRTKGGKVMRDELQVGTSNALIAYMLEVHGDALGTLAPETPIWINLSWDKAQYGQPLHASGLRKVWMKRLGTFKTHSTRHTFSVEMERQGAKLSDIGSRLGHQNLSTTSIYLQRLHSAENVYASKLEQSFGIH